MKEHFPCSIQVQKIRYRLQGEESNLLLNEIAEESGWLRLAPDEVEIAIIIFQVFEFGVLTNSWRGYDSNLLTPVSPRYLYGREYIVRVRPNFFNSIMAVFRQTYTMEVHYFTRGETSKLCNCDYLGNVSWTNKVW